MHIYYIYRFQDILKSLARAICIGCDVTGHYNYYYGPNTTTTTDMRFYDQNGNAQIWRTIIGRAREMIDPGHGCVQLRWEFALGYVRSSYGVIMTSSTVGKIYAVLS